MVSQMTIEMSLDEKIAVIENIADFDDNLSASCCKQLLTKAWEIEKAGGNQHIADFYRTMATFAMMPKPEQQRWLGKLEGAKDRLEEMLEEIKKGAIPFPR